MGKGALNEIRQVRPDLADDPEINELSEELDIADQLAGFVNTSAGQETIKRLGGASIAALNELFDLSRKAELGPLLNCIARLEQNLAMLRRFTGAKSDAEGLLDLLKERISKK